MASAVSEPGEHRWIFSRRLKVSIIAAVIGLGAVLSLAYYSELVPVKHISAVPRDTAISSVLYYTNGTYDFASGNTRWIMVVQTKVWTPASYEVATLYVFKVASGDSAKDLSIIGVDMVYNGTIREGANRMLGIFAYDNKIVVTVQYFLDAAGTYLIDFGLQVQVYSSFLSIPIAQEQIRVATDVQAHYG